MKKTIAITTGIVCGILITVLMVIAIVIGLIFKIILWVLPRFLWIVLHLCLLALSIASILVMLYAIGAL